MDRRIVLAGLAAALATPALAQTGGASPSPAQGGMSQTGQADMLQQHMQDTLRLGTVALETSRIALEKARNAELKRFAQFERDEQETIAEVLHSMMVPATTAGIGSQASPPSGQPATGSTAVPPARTGAEPTAARPAAAAGQLDAEGRQMIERLRSAEAGAAFDREYLQGQLKGHQELLQVQERFIRSNPMNREQLNVARLARGQIREHIALLEDMQQKIR
jgi:putative membrane protein